MKWFCALLLVANLVLWAYPSRPVAIPRVNAEINADKVKLIASLPVQIALRPASPVQAQEAETASATVIKPTPKPTPAPTPVLKAEVATACMQWSGIGQEQTSTMRARLKSWGISSTETSVSGKVWVYIPPQTDIELAKKKAQQLSDQGVRDYYVINNGGRWQNSISLGVFSGREGADRRLNELRNQGVKSAVVRERDDSPSHVTFALRKVSADQQQKLEKMTKQLKGAQLQQSKCS
ncbi:SPOR domain-containing protein [Iodobacter ciconiae]|uniref:SPOR domain-containing protein n=1 Tax=Iodobacter ciconiae TaxID=2496266 RepID=A0A3S8ZP21_9NEIS|nr:SPOR domain-containing protein [Iodobacter ciconiae]AZN35225.1 SPOR domain-containing protein [Iodobacter ciconiae]